MCSLPRDRIGIALAQLERQIKSLPVEQQLPVAAAAIVELAEMLDSRSADWFKDWEDKNSPEGPVLPDDLFAGLVRSTVQLDLDDLIAPPAETKFRKHKPHDYPEDDDSVVAEISKDDALALVDHLDLLELAGEEDPMRWSQAIWYLLEGSSEPINILKLAELLQMPLVEVWLGALLGGYVLEQKGEFYSKEVWLNV